MGSPAAQCSPLYQRERNLAVNRTTPPEHAALAEALAKKVNDFHLDQILDLTSNG